MKVLLKNILTCLLIYMVLVSSISYQINLHWCGGEIADFTFYYKNILGCGMEQPVSASALSQYTTEDENIQTESCCKDELVLIDGKSHQASVNKSKTCRFEEDYSFSGIFAKAYSLILFTSKTDPSVLIKHHHYKPPVAYNDIPVMLQVFRI